VKVRRHVFPARSAPKPVAVIFRRGDTNSAARRASDR
jgi:hypothetical protein